MSPARPADSPAPLILPLTERERRLILQEVRPPAHLVSRLNLLVVESDHLNAHYTAEELDELAECIVMCEKWMDDGDIYVELEAVWDRIQDILDEYLGDALPGWAGDDDEFDDEEVDEGPSSDLHALLMEKLDGMIQENPDADPREITEALTETVLGFNKIPDPAMGGLSPFQVSYLLYSDWDSEDSSVVLRRNLPLEDLRDAPLLQNARVFLSSVKEAGGIKTTQAGNLTRKFVERMVETLSLDPFYVQNVLGFCKVLNERNVMPIHVLRILLELSGLIRTRKGKFMVTKEGARLSRDENAGGLYASLFVSHFRRFNLGYLDQLPETSSIQATAPYALWALGQAERTWRSREELVSMLFLPATAAETGFYENPDGGLWLAETRILAPLQIFGLIETEGAGPVIGLKSRRDRIRKTELYDRFLSFRLA